MSTATAIRFHSVENPRKPFPMRQHLVYGGILAVAILAMKITDYICGLRLNGFSLVSPLMLVVPVLSIMIPVVLIRTLQGLYHGVSGRLSGKQFAKVPLPVIAAMMVMALPIPTFNDAVASQIRKHASSSEWVDMAKSIAAEVSAKANASDGAVTAHGPGTLPENSPLDRLNPARKPRVDLRGNTATLLWGGSLAQGWGIAISNETGKKPALPNEVTQTLEVYPEVTIFTLID